MKFSWSGLVLAAIYTPFAVYVLWDDLVKNVGMFSGLASAYITIPVSGPLMLLGVDLNFSLHPEMKLLYFILAVAVCAFLVYLFGWVLGWIGEQVVRAVGLSGA